MRRDLSMFVYPGSISRVSDRILAELQRKMTPSTTTFREVFAGSAIASIDIATRYPGMKFQVNDLDDYMYAFWALVASGSRADDDAFKKQLLQVPTVGLFNRLRRKQAALGSLGRVARAYHAVFFHRCTYMGVFFNGPRGGQSQSTGAITACYNGPKLTQVYDNLVALLRGRLTAFNLDAMAFMARFAHCKNDLWFFDPPWIDRGSGWYTHSMDVAQHRALANTLSGGALRPNSWLMIIGNHPFLSRLYPGCRVRNVEVVRGAGPKQGLATHRDKLIDRPR